MIWDSILKVILRIKCFKLGNEMFIFNLHMTSAKQNFPHISENKITQQTDKLNAGGKKGCSRQNNYSEQFTKLSGMLTWQGVERGERRFSKAKNRVEGAQR